MIQLITILILYWRISSLADNMWLWHDMGLVQIIAIVYGYGGAYGKLSKISPPKRLLTGFIIIGLVFQILVAVIFQSIVYFYTLSEPWFCSITDNNPSCFNRTEEGAIMNVLPNPKCDFQECAPNYLLHVIDTNLSRCDLYEFGEDELYEHYVTQALFLFTSFQYVTVGIVFSSGKPFRRPIYMNPVFVVTSAILTGINLLFLFLENDGIYSAFEMVYWPENIADGLEENSVELSPLPTISDKDYSYYRPVLFAIAVGHFLCSIIVEEILNLLKFWWKNREKKQETIPYQIIERKMKTISVWPSSIRSEKI